MSYSIAILAHRMLRGMVEPILCACAESKGVAITVISIDSVYDEGAILLEELAGKIDLVLCGRNHAKILQERGVHIPMIVVRPRDRDILERLLKMTENDSAIAMISHFYHENVLDVARPMLEKLGVWLREFVFQNEPELENIVETLRENSCKTVLCGTMAYDFLSRYPEFQKEYIFTDEAIAEVSDRVLEYLINRSRETPAERWAAIKPYIERITRPTILCDAKGVIVQLNHCAENTFGLQESLVLRRDIREIVYGLELGGAPRQQVVINQIPYDADLEIMDKDCNSLMISLSAGNGAKDTAVRSASPHLTFDKILGNSQIIHNRKILARQYALTDETVLITGETGVGKDLFAQSIHSYGSRGKGPFWAVNCAALPETLLESELFGYEEGAFTGANKRGKVGYFELADCGTLFLDEIGEISLSVQVKLLRVLEQRQVLRLGGKRFVPVDVRIICATNRDLYQAVMEKTFREDLYYRINVLQLKVPPLRERREDIPQLARYFYRAIAPAGREAAKDTKEFLSIFKGYNWPGNIRELENLLRRYVVMKNIYQSPRELYSEFMCTLQCDAQPGPVGANETVDPAMVLDAVRKCNGNQSRAARMLGISRVTVWRALNRIKEVNDTCADDSHVG